jgi:hypothetical protein
MRGSSGNPGRFPNRTSLSDGKSDQELKAYVNICGIVVVSFVNNDTAQAS